jgi:3-oxoacyl-[acyl-carrier protein] reductase
MTDVRGKTALITGGSQGIGRAIALRLGALGVKVAICARGLASLKSTQEELSQAGVPCLARAVDVTSAAQVYSYVHDIVAEWDRIDIVVNNAGVLRSGLIRDLPVEDWDLQFAVNLKGPFLVTRAVLPYMRQQQSGTLIYISSTAALISPPGNACYAATKWGLDGLVGSFARELCDDHIKCHTLRPGYVDTSLFDEAGRPENPDIDWIDPMEIADGVAYLLQLPHHAQVPDLTYTTTYQRKKF